MGITTLSVEEETAERFSEEYRHADHHNTTEALESLMAIVPPYDDLECGQCGTDPHVDAPYDDIHGFIHIFHWAEEHGGGLEAIWFCSQDCLAQLIDNQDLYTPDHPDAVIVGGYEQPRVRLESAVSFGRDGGACWATVDVPGAFGGADEAIDEEYDYEGEPIYVENRGRYIATGTIGRVWHEEWRTNLDISRDGYSISQYFHPDEETRESYREDATVEFLDDSDRPREPMEV